MDKAKAGKYAGAAVALGLLAGFGALAGSTLNSDSGQSSNPRVTIFCSEFVPNLEVSEAYKRWARQNAADRDRWLSYRVTICADQLPTFPVMTTPFGKALVAAGKMALTIDVPPPTTTTTTQPTTTTTTTTTTDTTTTTQPPGPCSVTTPNVPDGPDGMGGCFPGPSNTGPSGSLSAYTGSCNITVANTVIDSKNITCNRLEISTTGVVIKNSTINIGVRGNGSASVTIQDSLIDGLTNGYACIDCGVDGRNFTILRTEIVNTNRGAYCDSNCLIRDSWVHGTTLNPSSGAHASGVREQQYGTFTHNTLACDYTGPFNVNPETGCSADLTGYPDFAPIHHNTVEANLFIANNGGNSFCAYGGGTSGKPYSGDPLNATYQVFRNNVFQRGANGKCGAYGAITDFITGRTGSVWQNNTFDNGAAVTP